MTEPNSNHSSQPKQTNEGITRISVGGFKSISQEQSIEIRPLTILAGANSSGKSSIMQPLLLLKQTLEAPYDPGALLLNGPNVKFTLGDQLLSHNGGMPMASFHIGIESDTQILEEETKVKVISHFTRNKNKGLDIDQTIYNIDEEHFRFYTGMPVEEINAIFSSNGGPSFEGAVDMFKSLIESKFSVESDFVLARNRCFLSVGMQAKDGFTRSISLQGEAIITQYIRQLIHLPGLRGSPERNYPVTATGPDFSGTFENYVASVIEQWQLTEDSQQLNNLYHHLAELGLTNKVLTRRMDASQIELLVNRFRGSNKEDMVSIADVGLGVSQALPVIVAIQSAAPGYLVYIEQPEIHLHPRAQTAMAEVLAEAAKEGKRLVIETHSSLLLLGIQTLVAEGKLPPELVKLHWFTLNADGSTRIDSADLDERGAYGDWAIDFDDVALYSEDRFLNAQTRLKGQVGE